MQDNFVQNTYNDLIDKKINNLKKDKKILSQNDLQLIRLLDSFKAK
jgi:hypothetical protein